jgi:hypothetical protein
MNSSARLAILTTTLNTDLDHDFPFVNEIPTPQECAKNSGNKTGRQEISPVAVSQPYPIIFEIDSRDAGII